MHLTMCLFHPPRGNSTILAYLLPPSQLIIFLSRPAPLYVFISSSIVLYASLPDSQHCSSWHQLRPSPLTMSFMSTPLPQASLSHNVVSPSMPHHHSHSPIVTTSCHYCRCNLQSALMIIATALVVPPTLPSPPTNHATCSRVGHRLALLLSLTFRSLIAIDTYYSRLYYWTLCTTNIGNSLPLLATSSPTTIAFTWLGQWQPPVVIHGHEVVYSLPVELPRHPSNIMSCLDIAWCYH